MLIERKTHGTYVLRFIVQLHTINFHFFFLRHSLAVVLQLYFAFFFNCLWIKKVFGFGFFPTWNWFRCQWLCFLDNFFSMETEYRVEKNKGNNCCTIRRNPMVTIKFWPLTLWWFDNISGRNFQQMWTLNLQK